MYFVLSPHETDLYPYLMEQMFRLRARVFRDELGWIDTAGDHERDVYDDCCPSYIVHTDPTCTHLYAAARLMPTSGPTLLAGVFAGTIPAIEFQSPFVWEITRLAVDDRLIDAHGLGGERLSTLRNMLLAGMEFGVANGIDSFLADFDGTRLRMWRQLGARFDVIGTSDAFSTTVYLGLIEATPEALAELRQAVGVTEPLLGKAPAPALPLRAIAARSQRAA